MEDKKEQWQPDESAEVQEIWQHEDAALKTSMQFFAEELLPLFGITQKAVGIAPTELVHLDLKKLYQDFNVVMEDRSWSHFEFQSKDGGIKDLKRFRTYEALTSYQYDVVVVTYVLYSGQVKNPVTEFTEGCNTYRVIPIIMQGYDADTILGELEQKVESGEPVTKNDLVPLNLCLLMGGEMPQKERVLKAYSITQNVQSEDKEVVQKIESVLYAMADKFLEPAELQEIVEAISMTRLGQMLVDKGMQEGMKEGIKEGIKEGMKEGMKEGREEEKLANARNLIDLLDAETIAERIGLPLETVQKIKRESRQGTI